MVQDYREIEDRTDFRIQEVSAGVSLFLFDPLHYEVSEKKAAELIAGLPHVEEAIVKVDVTEIARGLITLTIEPIEEHYFTSKLVKKYITNFILDCEDA